MVVFGNWLVQSDGIVRPIIRGEICGVDGTWFEVSFLIDTGADRTVFSAAVLEKLRLPPIETTDRLVGVGGGTDSVVVQAQIRLTRENGSTVLFNGRFAAFTNPEVIDLSVLGRDILNLFAVIVDRPRDVVALVGPGHSYSIQPSA